MATAVLDTNNDSDIKADSASTAAVSNTTVCITGHKSNKNPDISIVVPCYNEEASLPLFLQELARVTKEMRATSIEAAENFNTAPGVRNAATANFNAAAANLNAATATSDTAAAARIGTLTNPLTFEVILIDDGSSDRTLAVIKEQSKLYAQDFPIRWISFSRNFGKEAALYAGLSHAQGKLVATMDADMQDPPSLLPKMYSIMQETDCDNVAARRTTRKGEPPIRSWFARMFYRIINKISKADIVDGARDFRLMKRPMVDAILSMQEYNRFSKGIFGWVGFDTVWLPFENINRVAGETKWNFFSLLLYSIDGIVAFSTVPLSIASVMGTIFCVIAFIALIFIVVRALLFGDPVSGWPSLASIIIFIGGVQLLCLGIIGQYLAKTYLETKNRPLYIIKESNLDESLR